MKMIRHHLLQIILWPNDDGTFKTILNSKERLKELGVYDDFKLTIRITQSQHVAMHNKYEKTGMIVSAETRRKQSEARRGKHFTDEHKANLSKANKGKAKSAEARQHMCENHADISGNKNPMHNNHTKCFNNGVITVRCEECPPGFTPGRLPNKKKYKQKKKRE